jgi:TonB family protein
MARAAIALLMTIAFCSASAAPPFIPQNKDSASVSNSTPDNTDDETFSHFEKVGVGIKPPKATHAPDPKFPDLPADAEDRGIVVMLVGVNAKGRVGAVHVLRSTRPEFEASALSTVKKWKFKPGEKGNQPIPVQVTVEMKFEK